MIKRKTLTLAMLLALAILLPSISSAAAKGEDQLLIQTSTPKRIVETAFSSMVAWRKEQAGVNKANGLTFIKGRKAKKPTTDIEAARKFASALNGGINYEAPHDRGASAEYNKGENKVLISNRESFNLIRITTRDYTNQTLRYSIPGKSFSAANVDVAIDLVYSAAVEYIDNFASNISLKTAGGFITVTIDNDPPIKISTDGKTTKQLETELTQAIGSKASFSMIPIYPNFTELKSRNYKAFDGGEVQLTNFNAKSISIDINDSGLGVLTKFSFPDIHSAESDPDNMLYIFLLLIAAVLGYIFYARKTA